MSLRSMTGFGRGEASSADCRCVVDLRAVNARFLDVRFKLPRQLHAFESKAREQIAASISRGTVELTVNLQFLRPSLQGMIKEDVAKAYAQQIENLSQSLGISSGLTTTALLDLPGVVSDEEAAARVDVESLEKLFLDALGAAVKAAIAMRSSEGAKLGEAIQREMLEMSSLLKEVEKERGQIRDRQMSRLQERLQSFEKKQNLKLDDARVLQELVFYIDRSDVTEEIDRLRSHFGQTADLVKSPKGAVGKRLDFLVQEMSRETNTIGAKSDLIEVTKLGMDMKTCLERVREQVQNLE